jgi:hypothetical protein
MGDVRYKVALFGQWALEPGESATNLWLAGFLCPEALTSDMLTLVFLPISAQG